MDFLILKTMNEHENTYPKSNFENGNNPFGLILTTQEIRNIEVKEAEILTSVKDKLKVMQTRIQQSAIEEEALFIKKSA